MTDSSLHRWMRNEDRAIDDLKAIEVPLANIGVRAFNSAAISINNNAVTALTFNSELYDTDGIHSIAVNTSRLTCTRIGIYSIAGGFEFAPNVAGVRLAYLRLNGGTLLAGAQGLPDPANVFGVVLNVVAHYSLVVGDYVELVVYQNSGGALNVQIGNLTPWLAMWRLP